jgi:hypothetical protein
VQLFIQGYNDGIIASEPTEEGALPRAVSPEQAHKLNIEKVCVDSKLPIV